MTTTISVPSGYGWILLEVVVVVIQCVTIGFGSMSLRKRLFNKEFFDKHFPNLKNAHKRYKEGYPDNGMGRFASKLSDEDWLELNNTVRPHHNYLEQVAPILVLLLVSGLHYTRVTALLGLLYIIGRVLYTAGYKSKGPAGRLYGVLVLDFGLVGLTITALLTAWSIAGGVAGLKSFVGF